MSLQNSTGASVRSIHSLAVEFGIVTAMLGGVYLWRELVAELLSGLLGPPPAVGGFLFGGLVSGGIFLLGLIAFTGAYAARRNIDVGVRLPSRADAALIGAAVAVPVFLVAVTNVVGSLTGVPYNSLTMTSVAADASVLPVLLLVGLGMVVGVPVLVVICQILVQGSFEQAVGDDPAVVLTTVVTGFVMVSDTGGLATVPELGTLLGAIIFTLSLAVALYTNERTDREWLQYLGVVPVALIAALVVLSGVAAIETIAGGLYAVTQLVVLGTAAYTYNRTGSLLTPAVAYATFLLTNRLVVYVFEAGMQSW